MGMNIKNPTTQHLAQEVAAITGETLTAAITEALRQRLESLRRENQAGLAERLLAIGKESAPLFQEPYRSIDPGDLLYDDRLGLPK